MDMPRKRTVFIGFALGLWLASVTTAQTTQPAAANAAWPAAVDRFTKALTLGDPTSARALTTTGATIARSGSSEQIDLATLVQRSSGGTVLATHLYSFPPIAMAADLAADFKSAPMIPEATKTLMVPADDAAMQRANATAIQWVAQVLGAVQGTPFAVALIMPSPASPLEKTPLPILVLMRGTASENGVFAVDRIVFGTPQQIIE
jgi:hypothetical protein